MSVNPPTPAPSPLPAVPKLPTWTSAPSVIAFASALLAWATAFVVAFHPGFTVPVAVQSAVPTVGVLVASGAVLYLVITHRRSATALASGTIPLPTWTDTNSVLSYLTSIVAAVFGILTAFGVHEPSIVQALLPAVALLVAVVAQAINASTHHTATVAAAKAHAALASGSR